MQISSQCYLLLLVASVRICCKNHNSRLHNLKSKVCDWRIRASEDQWSFLKPKNVTNRKITTRVLQKFVSTLTLSWGSWSSWKSSGLCKKRPPSHTTKNCLRSPKSRSIFWRSTILRPVSWYVNHKLGTT